MRYTLFLIAFAIISCSSPTTIPTQVIENPQLTTLPDDLLVNATTDHIGQRIIFRLDSIDSITCSQGHYRILGKSGIPCVIEFPVDSKTVFIGTLTNEQIASISGIGINWIIESVEFDSVKVIDAQFVEAR